MSDEEPPKGGRPNAQYKLSRENQDEKNLVFHYSRDKRLEKAPQAVRDLYSQPVGKPRFNFMGPLVGSKSRSLLFASILLICAVLMAFSIFSPSGTYKLNGNSITVQALKYEGAIIVLLKKSSLKNWRTRFTMAAAYTGVVDIGVAPQQPETNSPGYLHRIFFSAADTEEFRFAIPFESDKIIMVLQTETSQATIQLAVE